MGARATISYSNAIFPRDSEIARSPSNSPIGGKLWPVIRLSKKRHNRPPGKLHDAGKSSEVPVDAGGHFLRIRQRTNNQGRAMGHVSRNKDPVTF